MCLKIDLSALKAAASKEGGWLHICSPIERKIVIGMIVEGDHIQIGNKHFRRELASWVDPRRALSWDGMPDQGLKFSDIVEYDLAPGFAAF